MHEESGDAKKRRRRSRGGKKRDGVQDGQPKEKPQNAAKPAGGEKQSAKPQNGEAKPAGENHSGSSRRRSRSGKKPGSTTPGGEIRTQPQPRLKSDTEEVGGYEPNNKRSRSHSRTRRKKPKPPMDTAE